MSTNTVTFIHRPIIDAFLSKITIHIPFSYLWIYKKSVGNPITFLDVGCGDGLLMQRLSKGENWAIDGIDIYNSSVKLAREKGIYKNLIVGDVVKSCEKLIKSKKKYDTVFCSQLIEHITKSDGQKLIALMDKIAIKRVVVATPIGFMNQPEVFIKGNPHQHHKSGWSVDEMKNHGYKVNGLGFKFSWSECGIGRNSNSLVVLVSVVIAYIMSPFVYFVPQLAAGMMCIKTK